MPPGTLKAAPSAVSGPCFARWVRRSQFAVLFACQIPFRFGRPSGSRGTAVGGACARVSAEVAIRPATTSVIRLASTADLCLVQSFIEDSQWASGWSKLRPYAAERADDRRQWRSL